MCRQFFWARFSCTALSSLERGKGRRETWATSNPQFQLRFRYLARLRHTCYLARKEFVQLLLSKHVISDQLDSPVRFS